MNESWTLSMPIRVFAPLSIHITLYHLFSSSRYIFPMKQRFGGFFALNCFIFALPPVKLNTQYLLVCVYYHQYISSSWIVFFHLHFFHEAAICRLFALNCFIFALPPVYADKKILCNAFICFASISNPHDLGHDFLSFFLCFLCVYSWLKLYTLLSSVYSINTHILLTPNRLSFNLRLMQTSLPSYSRLTFYIASTSIPESHPRSHMITSMLHSTPINWWSLPATQKTMAK